MFISLSKQSLHHQHSTLSLARYVIVIGQHKANLTVSWVNNDYVTASRLVGRPLFEPSLSKDVLPLIIAANGPNGAILLAQTFNRILFHVHNRRYFGVQKAKNVDLEITLNTATLTRNIQLLCILLCSYWLLVCGIREFFQKLDCPSVSLELFYRTCI